VSVLAVESVEEVAMGGKIDANVEGAQKRGKV
jgi:hypothetical protein